MPNKPQRQTSLPMPTKVPVRRRMPVADLQPMTNLEGRCNRMTRAKILDAVLKEGWNPRGATPALLVYVIDGKHFVIDGHHRREGILALCARDGLDPRLFVVDVLVYDDTFLRPGETRADLIDALRHEVHNRVPETYLDRLQTTIHASPVYAAMVRFGVNPEFNNKTTVLNVKTILAVIHVVQQILDRRGSHAEDPDEQWHQGIVQGLNGDTAEDIWLHADSALALAVVDQITKWWRSVVVPAREANRGNFGQVLSYACAYFVACDPDNDDLGTPFHLRFDAKSKKAPSDKLPIDHFGALLKMAQRPHDPVYLFGRMYWGRHAPRSLST